LVRDLYNQSLKQTRITQKSGKYVMLVLSRKEGQQLIIGDNIVLTINRISGNRVAIGIDAPREVRIVRGELERHEVSAAGSAPVAMSSDETAVAVASKPH
jgi:carbon storage regulator